jgi:hypothetical protein
MTSLLAALVLSLVAVPDGAPDYSALPVDPAEKQKNLFIPQNRKEFYKIPFGRQSGKFLQIYAVGNNHGPVV